MLVLTRKEGQQILINKGTIQIRVLTIKGGSIRIGLIAPENIDIDREEVYIKKLAQRTSTLNHGA